MNESRSLPDPSPMEGGANGHDRTVETAIPLARRPDFRLGEATVRPSVRTVDGPGGSSAAEPRVMQVLLALADAEGAVLTRDDLIRICWNGQIVGDDSVHRAIAEVRRIARATDAGFGVETIPRIGYRLTGIAPTAFTAEGAARPALPKPAANGRGVLVGGLAAAVAGFGVWAVLRRDRSDPQAAELVERARSALRDELPDRDAEAAGLLREAILLTPDDAEAWGLLSVALRNVAEQVPPEETDAAVRACEEAARRALALDPREGNALAALATLRPYFGDWVAAEDRLRNVLAVSPDNRTAYSHLVTLLQSVGRARDSWLLNERAAELDPLSPIPQFRRALKFWIYGRVPEADLAIDRALQLWPRHPAVWNARLLIFAFTGRARAALAMFEDAKTRPAKLPQPAIDIWRLSLVALETGSPADVAAARKANVEAAPRSPGFALNAIMVLPMLGEVDAAFDVANGFFLRRGPLIGTLWTGGDQMPVSDYRWRRTMPLFIPATARLRADPRFLELCEGIGLVDYWRRRVRPDKFLLPAF